MPPALFFFLRIALAILGLLWFHINFRIICSSSLNNVIGILFRALNYRFNFSTCNWSIHIFYFFLIKS